MNKGLTNKEEPMFLSIYMRNDNPFDNMWWIQLPSEKEAYDYSLICKSGLPGFKFIISKELNEGRHKMVELRFDWIYGIMSEHFNIEKKEDVL